MNKMTGVMPPSVTGMAPSCFNACIAPAMHAVDQVPDRLLSNCIPLFLQELHHLLTIMGFPRGYTSAIKFLNYQILGLETFK